MQGDDAPTMAAAPADDDQRLVERAQAGDARAFEALVRRYERWVFTLAVRMLDDRADAEDASQEIFLKAHRGLSGFAGASRFSTWLYAIASHHCLNCLAARTRRASLSAATGSALDGTDPLATADSVPDGSPLPDALVEQRDLGRIIQTELLNLTEDHRLILILREIQGMSYEEIAETLTLELGTVRSRLHRARMELKTRLQPHLTEGAAHDV